MSAPWTKADKILWICIIGGLVIGYTSITFLTIMEANEKYPEFKQMCIEDCNEREADFYRYNKGTTYRPDFCWCVKDGVMRGMLTARE